MSDFRHLTRGAWQRADGAILLVALEQLVAGLTEMPNARHTSVNRLTVEQAGNERGRSSVTEHSFHGIAILRWLATGEKYHPVSGPFRHPCLETRTIS
jgi:hypothetical protein